ncbi:hypothetical protein [Aminipila sp.]|nr:hypothetical protein [Aminipila sp.]
MFDLTNLSRCCCYRGHCHCCCHCHCCWCSHCDRWSPYDSCDELWF